MTRGGRDHLREKPILGEMPILREKPILGEKPNLREKLIPGPKPWAGLIKPLPYHQSLAAVGSQF